MDLTNSSRTLRWDFRPSNKRQILGQSLPSVPQVTAEASASSRALEQREWMRLRSAGSRTAPSAGKGRTRCWLWQDLSAALAPGILRWAGQVSIWKSQGTDVPATLGFQPGLLPSLIPIFGCRSRLIHIPMSTLRNLP